MGVKSTRRLARTDAEALFCDLYMKTKAAEHEEENRKDLPDIHPHQLPFEIAGRENLDIAGISAIYLHVSFERRRAEHLRAARHLLVDMDDITLENELEALNDKLAGGMGFDNYIIV